jgi:hypothetical protein
MNDLPLAIDLDHGPVGVHVDDLAPAEPPDEPGALEVIKRAPWMASKQARGIPAEVGSAHGPVPIEKVANVAQENAPAMCWYCDMRW